MSSKIYFSNNSSKNIFRYLTNAFFKVLFLIAPSFTEKQVRKILLKPHNRAAKPIPENISKKLVSTEHGDLAIFETGDKNKPKILFTHGWSGSSSQFYELMQAVSSKGFYCIAFDHYAHQHSGGKECNFPLFVIGLREIIKTLKLEDDLHCVVSHSMGVAGTVNVFNNNNTPHFFIAPFFDFWHELSTRILSAGIPKKVFNQIINSIENDYGIMIKDLEPNLHMKNIKSPICIVHDPDDKFALYKFSKKYSGELSNIELQTINGYGHMRIVNAKETLHSLNTFLNRAN